MRRIIALLLTVLTGFSALVYEVAWQKYLASLLGSHSEATAAILGIFLGGLSFGYWLFGAITRRVVARAAARGRAAPLLLLYGGVEAGIGLYALIFSGLFRFAQSLSLASGQGVGGLGFVLDVGLTVLLIGPPTVLMGGTIPILTQALARGLDDATRIHAFIYAFNTAGAFIGAFAAGFFLIPLFGLNETVLAMGGLNLIAGASFLLLALGGQTVPTEPTSTDAGPLKVPGMRLYSAVALFVGFAAMALQTVLIRIGAMSLGSSEFTFATIVSVFVLCIALGSFAVSALPRIGPAHIVGSLWALVALLTLLYTQLDDAPYWAHVLRTVFRDEDAAFYPYYLSVFALTLIVLVVPVGLSGATLPLIFNQLRRETGMLGKSAGRLYAWNTTGSLLGALVGGHLLLLVLDLHHVYRIAVATVAVAALLVTAQALSPTKRWVAAILILPILGGLLYLPVWDPNRLASGLFRTRQPARITYTGPEKFFRARQRVYDSVFYTDDPATSVSARTINIPGRPADLDILTNGKSDGAATLDYQTMALVGLLPALFADKAESAFVIGYGTGISAGELAELRSMRRVVVSEISRGVIEAAPLFEEYNRQVLEKPSVEIVVSDAYRALLHGDERFDIIASEPSNPWATGVEMLFSREFLQAARDRLEPGGVYAQWFHLYETDTSVVSLVLRTYASVFDHVSVWFSQPTDLLLLGFDDPARVLDLERLEQRASREDFRIGLERAGIPGFPELLAHELLPLGVVHAAKLEGDVHTLLHPVLSYRSARAFYRGLTATLPSTLSPDAARVGAENALLRLMQQRLGGRLPDEIRSRVLVEVCSYRPDPCAALAAQWLHEDPGSAALSATLDGLGEAGLASQVLQRDLLTALSGFFGADPSDRQPLSSRAAGQATGLFADHYHHAAPYSREALAAIWSRCADSGCAAAVQGVEVYLGPLPEFRRGR